MGGECVYKGDYLGGGTILCPECVGVIQIYTCVKIHLTIDQKKQILLYVNLKIFF